KSVGLEGSERLYPSELSGGMRKRVAIARALLARQSVIIIDEAFSSLDLVTRNLIFKLLKKRLFGTKTVIVVTHDPMDAAKLASRFWILGGTPARLMLDLHASKMRAHGAEMIGLKLSRHLARIANSKL